MTNSIIDTKVNVGDVITIGRITYTVVRLDLYTIENSPKFIAANIGGQAVIKQGSNGKKLFGLALNADYTVKNGGVYNTGEKL